MTNDERDDLLIELKLKLENLGEKVDRISHVLIEGNGKPPLTEQVAIQQVRLERLEEERTDKKMPRAAWISIVLSSILSAISIGVAVLAVV